MKKTKTVEIDDREVIRRCIQVFTSRATIIGQEEECLNDLLDMIRSIVREEMAKGKSE